MVIFIMQHDSGIASPNEHTFSVLEKLFVCFFSHPKFCLIFLEAESDVFLGPSQGGREGKQGVLRG